MISNKKNNPVIQEILEEYAQTGLAQLQDSLENLFNQLIIAEREEYIGGSPYERPPDRRYYSNGFKDKTLLTRT